MLYGRTNLNQEWELNKEGEELVYSQTQKVLPIPGLLNSLNVTSDEPVFFYVFKYKRKERFVLVTKKKVCFRQLCSPLPRSLGEYAIIVEGALYDLERKRFIFSDGQFVLYDYGVPNVIYDHRTGRYVIFALKEGEYVFYTVKRRHQPIFVSHLWKNTKEKMGRPVNNRLIFFTPDQKDEESMVILHEELEFQSLSENVEFCETIPLNDEEASITSYFRSIHGKDGKEVFECHDVRAYHNKLLTFDDAVSVIQPTGEYNIVFVQNGRFVHGDSYDCYNYKKIFKIDGTPCQENLIQVYYRLNDFENRTAIFNFTTGKIV